MDAKTPNVEMETQDEFADAMHSIHRARAIVECIQMACEGMASEIGVPLDNTLESGR